MCFNTNPPLGIVYLFKPQNIYNSITPKQINLIDVGMELALWILGCSEPESSGDPKVAPNAKLGQVSMAQGASHRHTAKPTKGIICIRSDLASPGVGK